MRYRLLARSCLLVVVSAGGVKTLAASPDCARWVREYQQGLAKRATLAKRHVVHAARHLGVPRPRLVQASAPVHRLRPAKLTPAEMLKRFRVLCGEDLPDEPVAASFVPTSLDALMIPPAIFPDVAPLTDFGQPVSFVPTPAVATPGLPVTTVPGNTGGTPAFGFPGTIGGLTPAVPGAPQTPTTPITDVPSAVPEPGSLILLLTGALGAIPILARRRRA